MSFQAYLDAIEQKTGLTPAQLLEEAQLRGITADSRAQVVVEWLHEDYGLGRGHAMALFQVVKNGTRISEKHVGSTGNHRDDSDTLLLDGMAGRGHQPS